MVQAVLASFYNKTRGARKIIVVDLGFLGDSVHLVPALRELKRHYPAAQLHTLSAPVGAEVLRLTPCVDRPWAFPLGPPSPSWWKHWGIVRALRREHFDLAFNFSGADRTLFLTALTGAKWRVAYPGRREHFWSKWLIRDWIPRQPGGNPVFEQRRQMLANCGLELQPAEFGLRVPDVERQWALEQIPPGAIHLSLNASSPLKEWPLGHWVTLVRQLLRINPNARFVATGSQQAREQERLKMLARSIPDFRLQVLSDGVSIGRLAALLERCGLHIGGDSGVLHLAMALDLPTLALFRDYPAKAEWLPQGARHRHLLEPCQCLDSANPPCTSKGESLCLGRIRPEKVLAMVREMLLR